ncbi:hypothetical protein C0995_013257 [Termitomyces sp. Mi166|nr:hypothetical protein C0995_013257 [Termitomyces sp. Mi166\
MIIEYYQQLLYVVQGWSSVIPKFEAVDFVSYYIEIPVMLAMYIAWMIFTGFRSNFPGDTPSDGQVTVLPSRRVWYNDFVDANTVDLYQDEYLEREIDKTDDEQRASRINAKAGYLWRLYYWVV